MDAIKRGLRRSRDERVQSNTSHTSLSKSGSALLQYIKKIFPQKEKPTKSGNIIKLDNEFVDTDSKHVMTETQNKVSSEQPRNNANGNAVDKRSRQEQAHLTNSNSSVHKSPYLTSREQIQVVSRCITEKRTYRKKTIEKSNNLCRANSGELDKSPTKKKKVKKSVLTLPTAPAQKRVCPHSLNGLEICDTCRAEFYSESSRNEPRTRLSRHERRRTPMGDKTTTDSERDQHSKASEELQSMEQNNDLVNLFNGKDSECPTYIISRTMTPERDLNSHDVWNILREINRRQYKPSPQISEESILFDSRPTKRKSRKRRSNNTRVLETSRMEEITYLSSFGYDRKEVMSNASSADCVTVIDVKQHNGNMKVVAPSKQYYAKDYFDNYLDRKCANDRLKLYFESTEITDGVHDVVLSSGCGNKKETQYKSNVKDMSTQAADDDIEPIAKKRAREDLQINDKQVTEKQNEPITPRYGRNWRPDVLKPRMIERKLPPDATPVNNNYQVNNRRNKLTMEIPCDRNQQTKMTTIEIKKKLATIKFPLVITGKDIIAEVRVSEYEAPQFSNMNNDIWPFMTGWSKDYDRDNPCSNKYMKLLAKQTRASVNTPDEPIGKFQKKRCVLRKREKDKFSRLKVESDEVHIEDKVLKVIFQNTNEQRLDLNKIESRQGRRRIREETQNSRISRNKPYTLNKTNEPDTNTRITNAEVRCSSPERKAIIDIFVENLKTNPPESQPTNSSNKSNPTKDSTEDFFNKLSLPKKLKYDMQKAKIEEILKKLESNHYRVHQEVHDATRVSPTRCPFLQPQTFNKRKKNLEQIETTQLCTESPRPTENDSTNENPASSQKEHFRNELIRDIRPPSRTETKILSRKTRKKMLHSFFLNPLMSMPAKKNQLIKGPFAESEANIPKPIASLELIEQAISNVRIPGFEDFSPKMVLKSLSRQEMIIEDPVKNIAVSFEVLNYFDKTNHLPETYSSISIDIKCDVKSSALCLSSNSSSANKLFQYKANYKLNNATLPEQICSLWPTLLNQIQKEITISIVKENCGDDSNSDTCKQIVEVPRILPMVLTSNVGHLHADLQNLLQRPERENTSLLKKNIKYCSDWRNMFEKVTLEFIREYNPQDGLQLSKYGYKEAFDDLHKPTLDFKSTPKIKSYYHSRNLWDLTKDRNDAHIIFFAKNQAIRKRSMNSMLLLHQDNAPYLTFAIPVKVIETFLKLISNENFISLFIKTTNPWIDALGQGKNMLWCGLGNQKFSSCENIQRAEGKTCRHKSLRMSSSESKITRSLASTHKKFKCRWKGRNSMTYFRKVNFDIDHSNLTKPMYLEEVPIESIKNIEDFLKLLGWNSKSISREVIDGMLACKILSTVKEMTMWSQKLSPAQALLILLISSKTESRSMIKFHLALVHGIASKRIKSASELDLECQVIEQDVDIDNISTEDDNRKILEELYSIAKETASEYDKPFNEDSIVTLDSLLRRKRKLNPSYLKVMAKYVGLGLLASHSKEIL